MNNDEKYIDELLKKYYDATNSDEELEHLFYFFLHLKEVPPKWKADAVVIRQLAIRRYCKQHEHEIRKLIAEYTKQPPRRSRLPLPAVVYRVAAVLLLLVGVGVALYSAWEQAPLQPTATVAQQSCPPAVQHSEPVADTATMPTPKSAPTMQPAADRDCQAMYAAHKEPTAPTPVPDTIAAPPTMGPQPLLLAEAEPETKPEPNYNDNNYTDYLIADTSIEKERQLTELQMYCSTRCSSNEVFISFDKGMGKKIMI